MALQLAALALEKWDHGGPVMRMERAVVIAVEDELGGAGPPLGNESALLPHPMMPFIVHAQSEAVSIRPGFRLVGRARVPFNPAFAPLAHVFARIQWVTRRTTSLMAKSFHSRNELNHGCARRSEAATQYC
jgi:hypothetical protein